MLDLWYKSAILYCIDVETYRDANGDGVGDFEGLTGRLNYIAGLGITCIWLMPFYPTPNKDNGYDVMDYYNVDPRLGTLGDFVEFARQAHERGIRRRFAPMVDGNRRRLRLAYSLMFTLPGTPVVNYGEELGMGDDLSLEERNPARTPMQWSSELNAGFSTAPANQLVLPVISQGKYSYKHLNVIDQRRDPKSKNHSILKKTLL